MLIFVEDVGVDILELDVIEDNVLVRQKQAPERLCRGYDVDGRKVGSR
jgi:hypothetical protein